MDKASEKKRFNELTKEKAEEIGNALEGSPPALRSCWNCNGAHDHLKSEKVYFTCFSCGITYVGGFPAPVFGMRLRGEEITDEVMDKYEQVLQDAE